MRKRINSIFLAMLALFAFQGNVSAQDVIFENSFNSQEIINNWTLDGYLKDTGWAPYFDASKGCMSFVNNNDYISSSIENTYVVSPEMTLGENNIVSINHASFNGASSSTTNEELMGVAVRTVGGSWTELTGITYSPDWRTFVTSGDLQIPAEFNNQNVQIAFRFTGNGNDISAQWFIKDIKVTKAAGGSAEPELIEQTLFSRVGSDLCNATYNGFKIEGYNYDNMDYWNPVVFWSFNDWDGVKNGANGKNIESTATNIESYLVTPNIKLFKQNRFELKHFVSDYAEGEAAKALSLCIREVLTVDEWGFATSTSDWETVEGLTFFANDVVDLSVVDIDAKYEDKLVQFGMRYTAADQASAGSWYFSSMEVYGMTPEPKDPAISFDVTEMKYEVGSKNFFEAPTINNPLGATVHYSSSDPQIANVDSQTGEVTIGGRKLGTVTITAMVDECIDFYAGEASYTINVVDPLLIFKADFINGDGWCGFTTEETNSVWVKDSYYGVAAQAPVEAATTSYLISPEITLDANDNIASFTHASQNIPNINEHVALCIRTIGGEWTELPIENWPAPNTYYWDTTKSGDIEVPAEFNGQTVQFAFRFTADEQTFADNIGQYEWGIQTKYVVNNFFVNKKVVRAEAGLSFDKAEVTYYTTEETFNAPALNNPNEISVVYRSENMDVATIDIKTGEVTIKGIGTTTIYAESQQNNEFLAGSASYVLNVVDPTIIFSAPFRADGLAGFTEEGATGIWHSDNWVNTGAESNSTYTEGTKAYLVSPKITLGTNNKVSWSENGYMSDLAKQGLFAIREIGGEWVEYTNIDRSAEEMGGKKLVKFDIPAEFENKDVQVAFVFIMGDPNSWHSWNINDLIIRADFNKADPALAFDKEAVKVKLGEEFTAPVLSNPENVEVTYSSSDETVAKVDAEGVVTIVGKGETTIKAFCAETPIMNAGEASYVLTVINPVDPEISFSQTEVIYDATMGDFVAPEFNNPNNVEVTFSSSDETVATVDAATGVVTLVGDGFVTITATSIATEDFIAGTATYTITISKLTGIEGVTMEDLMNGKVYDLQGNRVQNIVKGAIYIVNGKKVIIK